MGVKRGERKNEKVEVMKRVHEKKLQFFFMRSMFLCLAQTLTYCNTPSRIF